MSKENKNIVKEVCKELGINQAELARMLDVPASTVGTWANGKIPKMAQMALELMIENQKYKTTIEKLKEAQSLLNSL